MPPWQLFALCLPLAASAAMLAAASAERGAWYYRAATTLAVAGSFLALPACLYHAAVSGREFLRLAPAAAGLVLVAACSLRRREVDRGLPFSLLALLAFFHVLLLIATPRFDALIQKLHAQRRLAERVPGLPAAHGPVARQFAAPLAEALGDSDPYVRWWAAEAARRLEPEAAHPVDALARAARDGDARAASAALEALAALGPKAEAAVPALVAVARERDGYLKARAAKALGRIGPAAAPGLEALAGLFGGYYGEPEAAEAIVLISSEPARWLEPFLCESAAARAALHELNTPEARAALGGGGPSRLPNRCKR